MTDQFPAQQGPAGLSPALSLRHMISPPFPVYRDVVIASIFVNLFTLVLPLLTMSVYQTVLPASATATLIALTIGVVFIILLDWWFNRFKMQRVLAVQTQTDISVAKLIFEKMADARLDGRVMNSGRLMTTIREFDQARSSLASGLISVFIDGPFLVLFLALLLWISPLIGTVSALGAIVILISGVINARKTIVLHDALGSISTRRHAVLLDAIRNFIQARVTGWMPKLREKHDPIADEIALANANLNLSHQDAGILTKTLVQGVQTLTTMAGAWAVIEGNLSMSALIGFSMLAARTAGIAGQIAAIMPRWVVAKKSLQQVEAALRVPQEKDAHGDFIQTVPANGSLNVSDVEFSYPEMPVPALQNITMNIPAGKKILLMGPSGSGKTTLLHLLMGLFPVTKGHIRYADTDISYIDPNLYRKLYSAIMAEPVLFGDTMAEWFSADRDANGLSIAETHLKDLGFESFIRQHPKGMHRPLENGGQGFSIGQKKVVALIRAIMSPAPILFMDEPTEGMDKETRRKIFQKIGQAGAKKTVIMVSHDDEALNWADYIGILGGGRLLMFDSRENVLKNVQNDPPG